MALWPSALPLPKLDGYALDPMDQTVRTDMEFGAARVRRRSKVRNDKLAVSWIFNAAQMAIFRAWFESDTQCAGGAAWFDIVVNTGDGATTSKVCRFSGPWKASLVGANFWIVSATLEVR